MDLILPIMKVSVCQNVRVSTEKQRPQQPLPHQFAILPDVLEFPEVLPPPSGFFGNDRFGATLCD